MWSQGAVSQSLSRFHIVFILDMIKGLPVLLVFSFSLWKESVIFYFQFYYSNLSFTFWPICWSYSLFSFKLVTKLCFPTPIAKRKLKLVYQTKWTALGGAVWSVWFVRIRTHSQTNSGRSRDNNRNCCVFKEPISNYYELETVFSFNFSNRNMPAVKWYHEPV